MAVPDSSYNYCEKKEEGWVHCLSLPRELRYKNGRIWQYPIEETKSLRTQETKLNLQANECLALEDPCFELFLQINDRPFTAYLRADTVLTWDGKLLELKMGPSGAGRTVRHLKCDSIESLELFSDVSSLEIFLNHGEYALSTRVYDAGQRLSFSADIPLQGILWKLGSIKIDYTLASSSEENQLDEASISN